MSLKKFINSYFGYSRRERTGSLVLFIILLSLIIIRLSSSGENPANSDGMMSNTVLLSDIAESSETIQSERVDSRVVISRDDKKSSLNPVSKKKTIPLKEREIKFSGSDEANVYRKVDLNKSDSSAFEQLPGIGPVLSARIVKFRNLLGGYVSVAQLKEVYGLKEDVIDLNKEYFDCDSSDIMQIKINSATFSTLLRHPYISKEQVKDIFNYRRLAGSLSSKDDLLLNRIFTNEELVRLAPYISFDQE